MQVSVINVILIIYIARIRPGTTRIRLGQTSYSMSKLKEVLVDFYRLISINAHHCYLNVTKPADFLFTLTCEIIVCKISLFNPEN